MKTLRYIPLLVLLTLVSSGCLGSPGSISPATPDIADPNNTFTELPQNTAGEIEVYFSDFSTDPDGNYTGGPDQYLVEAIDSANLSIDVAIYSINLWSVRDALLRARQRGVIVRMVMESENMFDEVPQALADAGIEILGDRREGLMHNKFTIIDRQEVWTGSMNYTIGSAYYDANNLVRIKSAEVAEHYLTEFDEMFTQDMFGNNAIPSTIESAVNFGDSSVEVFFSPDDRVQTRLIEMIKQSQSSVLIMVYSFTLDDLGAALIEKHNQGIRVEGIMDLSQTSSNQGNEYANFISSGISMRRFGEDALLHHKAIILDRETVITGSYNFSRNAETKNDENILIIHSKAIAEKYIKEYERLLAGSVP